MECSRCKNKMTYCQMIKFGKEICSRCWHDFKNFTKEFDKHIKNTKILLKEILILRDDSWIYRREFWKWFYTFKISFDENYKNKKYFGAIESVTYFIRRNG